MTCWPQWRLLFQAVILFNSMRHSLGRKARENSAADPRCGELGSVLGIAALGDSFALETHIHPSAGCELILSPDLKLKSSLFGRIVGHFGDGGILYHRSQIHFATVHPAEIAIYIPATGKDYNVFPREPFQEVRLQVSRELREFYKTYQDYCQEANDPCDPESFCSSLEGTSNTQWHLLFPMMCRAMGRAVTNRVGRRSRLRVSVRKR